MSSLGAPPRDPTEPFELPAAEPVLVLDEAEEDNAPAIAFAHPDPRARVELAREYDSLLEEADWRRLISDPVAAVRAATASRAAHEREVMDSLRVELARERHPGVRVFCAKPHELILLAGHPDAAIRKRVAGHAEASLRTLRLLATDEAPLVRAASCFGLAYLAQRSRWADDDRAMTTLMRLARDPDADVRRELAQDLAWLARGEPDDSLGLFEPTADLGEGCSALREVAAAVLPFDEHAGSPAKRRR
jgi:hypothetical protein